MILIITSQGNSLESKPNPRFGRSLIFIIYNFVNNKWQAVENPAINEPGGAGVAASQFIINQQASAVISGSFGPNAFQVLETAGIQMWALNEDCDTIQKVIELFMSNSLKKVTHPG